MPILDIGPYFTGNKRHQFYNDTVKQFNAIRTHALGEMPRDLITKRRPGETEVAQKYREEIFIPVTQATITKVFNSLGKIRKSSDYIWEFDKSAVPPIISETETPFNYLMNDYPRYSSLDNWFWSVAFNQYLMDANAMIMVIPLNFEKAENEYYKPFTFIFNSPNVLDYVPEQYAVFKSVEKSTYRSGNRTYQGDIYWSVDTISYVKYEQIDAKGTFRATEYIHNLGELPVIKTNGVIMKDSIGDSLYTSRIHSLIPSLNEASREYSDHQLEVVQHIHSTLWFINGKECNHCHGTGMIPKANGSPVQCDECGGKGMYPFNPLEHIALKMPTMGEANPPTPPAGFITKPIDIAKLQDQRINDHLYNALASVNMEFLANVPLSQSGTAKEVDRAELNNFVYSIAEDCVRILDEISEYIIMLRYSGLVTDEAVIEAMEPMISVPEKYDLIPESYMVDEISKLRNAKVSPIIVNAAELEYASKKFNTNSKIRFRLQDIYELDPLAGMATEDIMVGLSNGAINKKTYVIHCNIREFVDQAHESVAGFNTMTLTDKKSIINGYADQWMAANAPRSISQLNINGSQTGQ